MNRKKKKLIRLMLIIKKKKECLPVKKKNVSPPFNTCDTVQWQRLFNFKRKNRSLSVKPRLKEKKKKRTVTLLFFFFFVESAI